MSFKDTLNNYINILNCSSKELSTKSNISEAVISRYRSGERTPKENSEQLKKISEALNQISKEKNITKLNNIDIYNELLNSIKKNDPFDYDSFSKNLSELINTLKININEMSKYITFDASHISRIRYGKTKPSDPINFCTKVTDFIISKYNTEEERKALNLFLGTNDINDDKELFELIFNYLTKGSSTPNNEYISSFLTNLDNFNLNDYIKAIHFDELKVPTIPFYRVKSKNYYGLEEMKKGEIDFFKATILSKDNKDIFMCSDMPMEDMAKDTDFGKKWMFAIAICLKKGLRLNIIHNLDRPFNEMMLGLESWIPIYMTGQVNPYYLKEVKNSVYNHLNYVSGSAFLAGECIKGYHDKGKYYLSGNTNELAYYQEKANLLLKKANHLMDIYTEENYNSFKTFLNNDVKALGERKRVLSSLPLFTIDDNLLMKILIRNNLNEEEIKIITDYKKDEEKHILNILKNNIITDYLPTPNKDETYYLTFNYMFYNKKIEYTYKEYLEHFDNTKDYIKKNKNYKIILKDNTFKNISFTIIKNKYVILSKVDNPSINFIIKHPKLVSAIEKFTPLVNE